MAIEIIKGIRMIKKKKGNIWRVERKINGFKFDKSFTRECDARTYLATIEAMGVSHSGSNNQIKKIKFGKLVLEHLNFIKTYRDEKTFEKAMAISRYFNHLSEFDYESLSDKEIMNSFKDAKNFRTAERLSKSTLISMKVFMVSIIELGEGHGFPRAGKKILFEEITRIVNSGTPPQKKKHYRQKQVAQWFHSEELEDFWVRTISLILVTTSLRISEVLAMTWSNINFETNSFYVCQMFSSDRFYNRLKKNAPFFDKNLEDVVVERLKLLRKMYEEQGIVSDWVFPSPTKGHLDFPQSRNCPHKGRPMTYEMAMTYIKRDQSNAGLTPINLHGLRITGATLEYIRNKGTPLAWDRVKKKLNHRSLATSEGYIQIAMEDIEQYEREQNKGSFLDYCLDGDKSHIKKVQVTAEFSEEDLLDRQIMIEEKRTKFLELKKRNDEFENYQTNELNKLM